jgi:hypothetical protein
VREAVGLWDRDYMRQPPPPGGEPFVRQDDPIWEPADEVARLRQARRRYRWRRRLRFCRDLVLAFVVVFVFGMAVEVVWVSIRH